MNTFEKKLCVFGVGSGLSAEMAKEKAFTCEKEVNLIFFLLSLLFAQEISVGDT